EFIISNDVSQSDINGIIMNSLRHGFVHWWIVFAPHKMIVNLQIRSVVNSIGFGIHQFLPGIKSRAMRIIRQFAEFRINNCTIADEMYGISFFELASQEGSSFDFEALPVNFFIDEIQVLNDFSF